MTDGIRTRDVQDHNLALYQLSYGHRFVGYNYHNRRPRRKQRVSAARSGNRHRK